MKILVTGSKGQLGNEIQSIAKDYIDFEFLFTDIDDLDITNAEQVNEYFKLNRPDAVINCAAYTAVDKAESDIEMAYRINHLAVENLAKSASAVNALIVHVSTDYVFDGQSEVPYTESDSANPQSVYGKSKLAGEQAVNDFALNGVIIRTSWLYSAFGANFIKTILRVGSEKKELNVVFDQIGTPTYAKDLSTAILDIIPQASKKNGVELFHYSNEGETNWYEFAKTIVSIAGLDCKINPILSKDYPVSAPRPSFSVLCKSKIKETYGISIPYWLDSVNNCMERLK
ncbi:MAG: dTDP-4-dehydrorhamnose reductase [Bacteroidia bacterium]|nr:dTDP-4-dehydrorhamnose reductase [Bacteroidia bacterium]